MLYLKEKERKQCYWEEIGAQICNTQMGSEICAEFPSTDSILELVPADFITEILSMLSVKLRFVSAFLLISTLNLSKPI